MCKNCWPNTKLHCYVTFLKFQGKFLKIQDNLWISGQVFKFQDNAQDCGYEIISTLCTIYSFYALHIFLCNLFFVFFIMYSLYDYNNEVNGTHIPVPPILWLIVPVMPDLWYLLHSIIIALLKWLCQSCCIKVKWVGVSISISRNPMLTTEPMNQTEPHARQWCPSSPAPYLCTFDKKSEKSKSNLYGRLTTYEQKTRNQHGTSRMRMMWHLSLIEINESVIIKSQNSTSSTV